ncbi:MAG TPA: DUF4331 domain-containing protein [Candidatus Limnocylindrales bacterium]|nr:DUF4331 domain-containing protein [Candidatus Limnocylindrales bacterium]
MHRSRPLGVLVGLLVAASAAGTALGASHREAPLISLDPAADNTDVYAFVSPDRPDSVTIIANYIPLEEPAGGPNFFRFDPTVLYAIHVDNDGDAIPDVSYEFRFSDRLGNPNTFLYNTGPITSLGDGDWNLRQDYEVVEVREGTRQTLGSGLPTMPVRIGPRSTPNYGDLVASAVQSLPGGIKTFVGQRDDTFQVDLGSIFDLGGLRPFNAFHIIPRDPERGVDGVGGFNTHSIAIQVPMTGLTRDGQPVAGPSDPDAVIGIYANASRRSTTILSKDGSRKSVGDWRQVSRLANPLVNEVIIPLGRKDYWNSQDPADDAQFVEHFRSPELAKLVNLLYPATADVDETGRDDLVAILLTGVPGLNFTGPRPADLLRLNMGIPPCTADSADDDVGQCRRLGVLDGDLAGFPNGRRLTDDVTDIELRAVAQGYGAFLAGLLGLPNKSPNNLLTDGVVDNDLPNLSVFPYQANPHEGYLHTHHRLGPAIS